MEETSTWHFNRRHLGKQLGKQLGKCSNFPKRVNLKYMTWTDFWLIFSSYCGMLAQRDIVSNDINKNICRH